ncbi:MAG: ABC transporter permease [Cyclobacteriaceae bacterium]|jgi:lipopolysaccharide transport system permease protein|nr:ABC transporter permease [Cyclobacteriaceae bacterium]
MPEPTEFTIDASRRGVFHFSELWRYRELFFFFTWRDIKIKYKQTVLGFLWAILQPLLMMVIFTFFFGRALNIPSGNLPYPIYVFSGLLVWNLFSSGLTSAANSMVSNAPIIKKIYFPRLVIPISSILVALFDTLMGFVLFALLLIAYQQPVFWWAVLVWPMCILVGALATLGLGVWLSALNVKYRDFRYVIPFLVQVLFFLTPVIYPITLIDVPALQYALALSPMYAVVELFRYPLTGQWHDGWLVAISLGANVIFLLIGAVYFKRTEDFFADFA